jgi:hypothetical protein
LGVVTVIHSQLLVQPPLSDLLQSSEVAVWSTEHAPVPGVLHMQRALTVVPEPFLATRTLAPSTVTVAPWGICILLDCPAGLRDCGCE